MNEIQRQVKNIASKGRYGDSMLMHVNPAEVRGLASAMPLTINPETGQPEAFLPFLAPIAGSLLGSSLLAGVGGMSALTAGALGSGLAQWAATGDLKKGLLAGLTGYGLGTAMQGAGAAKAGADATAAATQTATDVATQNILNNPIAADAPAAPLAVCNAVPTPYPVKPASNPFLRSPVAAYCARPEPTALPNSVLPKAPPNKEPPNKLPAKGARKGKNASGCPVCGLTVIGIADANPFTSAGLTCKSIESP